MLTALAIAGVVISAIYGLRAAARVFFGSESESLGKVLAEQPATDLSWSERIPALLLVAMLLLVGLWPKSITVSINEAVEEIYPAAIAAAATPEDVAQN